MGRSGSASTSTASNRETSTITLLRGYVLLQYAYGWTKDYIKGKWVKICKYSTNPCEGSCSERKACNEYDLELYGLTRPLFVKYVRETSNELYEREKRLYNSFSLMITGNLFIKEDKKSSAINIEEKKKDVLFDFPYDVEYPTEKMIIDNLKYWKDKEDGTSLAYWDKERADACRGDKGVVARRCSVNDVLWDEFKKGSFKTQKDLKCRIKLDHIRLACYPRVFPRNKICVDPPPIDHFKSLLEDDQLGIYIRQLKECGFNLGDVLPLNDEHLEVLKGVKEWQKSQ